ncbi:MAG: ADP-dependent NAD(P)H-hydrate dehydratase / NAD(P)H-hydrate epimerase [Blastocatellia bacterium]|nr:ADP-dependent NAD(P)H-hydrate dehydratase / NAD(P)H-hydrate epimerase [Blastocatellia bacterium]
MREIDRLTAERFATPTLLLMEAAAAAALQAMAARCGGSIEGKRIRILCGRGNNGGDGAALARACWLAGARVDVVLFGRVDETKGDARVNFEMARRLSSFEAGSRTLPPPLTFVECGTLAEWEEVAGTRHSHDIIVDALFGTGLTRPLAGLHEQVVEHIALMREARERSRTLAPLIVSLDLPSGLNADSAAVTGETVRADLTVTFTAPKPANVLPPASHYGGQLVVAAIGSPPVLLEASHTQLFVTEEEDARSFLSQTRYTPDSYKNTHGHALVIAGSREMTGAAVLAANAAMLAGAGLVTVATPTSAQAALAAQALPEIMTAALAETESGAISALAVERALRLMEKASVVAIGPGLTVTDEGTRQFVRAIVEGRSAPLVIDADALNALAPWPEELRGSPELPLILTPHPGEMARLCGASSKASLDDRVTIAREFAVKHALILVLKGTRTLVATPEGNVCINPTGNAGLGTAGAGDTLTGIITGFLAQSAGALGREADALAATVAAVYTGGLAGDMAARSKGMRAMLASDIARHLGEAVRALNPAGEMP